jgi:hypothetical protein
MTGSRGYGSRRRPAILAVLWSLYIWKPGRGDLDAVQADGLGLSAWYFKR